MSNVYAVDGVIAVPHDPLRVEQDADGEPHAPPDTGAEPDATAVALSPLDVGPEPRQLPELQVGLEAAPERQPVSLQAVPAITNDAHDNTP